VVTFHSISYEASVYSERSFGHFRSSCSTQDSSSTFAGQGVLRRVGQVGVAAACALTVYSLGPMPPGNAAATTDHLRVDVLVSLRARTGRAQSAWYRWRWVLQPIPRIALRTKPRDL